MAKEALHKEQNRRKMLKNLLPVNAAFARDTTELGESSGGATDDCDATLPYLFTV